MSDDRLYIPRHHFIQLNVELMSALYVFKGLHIDGWAQRHLQDWVSALVLVLVIGLGSSWASILFEDICRMQQGIHILRLRFESVPVGAKRR